MRPRRDSLDSGTGEPPWRTFVAIELPDAVKQVLVQTQDSLRLRHGPVVRWVNPEGIHLTLKFLGNVAKPLLPRIETVLQQATSPFSPFHLSLTDAGVFPNWRSPRVVWLGMGGEREVLVTLQQRVEEALAELGFTPEARPFSPHLTLGRVHQDASPAERQALGEAVQALGHLPRVEFYVEAVSLIRSELRPGGAIYTRLASFPLAGLAQNTHLV